MKLYKSMFQTAAQISLSSKFQFLRIRSQCPNRNQLRNIFHLFFPEAETIISGPNFFINFTKHIIRGRYVLEKSRYLGQITGLPLMPFDFVEGNSI